MIFQEATFLIEHLPGLELTKEDQLKKIQELHVENDHYTQQLELELNHAQLLLSKLQKVYKEACDDQLLLDRMNVDSVAENR
jgi:hypothetical protein